MSRNVLRSLLCMVAAASLSACAVTQARQTHEREMMTRRIVDDAIAYNEAYNTAISGQILLNILRAYNRQPRQYMSMSGFANSTPDARSTGVSVSDLPLGELGEQWGVGSLAIGRDHQLGPEFNVEPFNSNTYANIALLPTPSNVFKYYWDVGWNRDLLVILLVDQITISSPDGGTFANNAGTISANCEGENGRSGGCAFIARARALSSLTRSMTPLMNAAATDGACYPVATYDAARVPTLRPAPAAGAAAPPCPVTIIVGETTYTLRLRSLDDAIYYVGELLRPDPRSPSADGVLEARLQVIAPGSRDELAPLFRVSEATADSEREYVATVSYAGRRLSAGAPANWFCYDPRGPEHCRSPGADRAGTVLELLAGILAFNQSEAAVRAPQNTFVR